MVTRKKAGSEKTSAQKKLMILAVYPGSVRMTEKQRLALGKALKTAAETSVESLESLNTVVVSVPEGD